MEYVKSKAYPLIQIVKTHQGKTNSTILHNARNIKEKLEKWKMRINDIITEKIKDRWQRKRMHGQFPLSLDEKLVDNEECYRFRKFWDVKGETESAILVAQDQEIRTNYFKS